MNTPARNLEIRRLTAEAATPTALAPFGAMITRASGAPLAGVDYYRGAVAVSRPANFQCEGDVELSLAALEPRPLRVRYLERHFRHTQAFLPLGGRPWAIVLAPASADELPALENVRAFRFEGDAGLCLHLGTWHEFPFPLEGAMDVVVVLSSQVTQDLTHRDANGIEASGPDLDKKDITLRAGIEFEVVT